VLLTLAILLIVVEVGLNPWSFHIGGKFTPTGAWSGYGTVQASNGGHYVLSVSFRGGPMAGDELGCDQFGCDNLQGTAKLCTASRVTYTFPLTGKVRTWLSTSGARTDLSLTGGSPTSLPDGWVVALRQLAWLEARRRLAGQLLHRGIHPARCDQDRDLDGGRRYRECHPRPGHHR